MYNFGLIGVAGYIAPRHLKAIQDTGNQLLVALDRSDTVGILDRYFPNCAFYTEFERFDRYVEKIKHSPQPIHYLSVCTPNYLHDAHIRFGLRVGCNVICEKPLVLNPWNIDALERMEQETCRNVRTILQLRLHPAIQAWKRQIDSQANDHIHDIDLTYITPRGKWYHASWKGDQSKSGGVATNIGVHFYDMLSWIFGDVQQNIVHLHTHDRVAGMLHFQKARVRYFLSINPDTLPESVRRTGKQTYRNLTMNQQEIDFSDGFTELHTKSYEDILSGGGFGLADSRSAIQIVHDIRNASPIGCLGDYHPLAKHPLCPHPFARSR